MQELVEHLKDFFCGCVSGWVQVLVMQPFEIIKVRLINQSLHRPEYRGIFHAFSKIKQEEGLSSFYKGTLTPLIGVGAQVSLQFGSNELVKKLLSKFGDTFFEIASEDEEDPVSSPVDKSEKDDYIPMGMIFLAGLLTGIPSSIAVTPVDHTRILLQLQKGSDHKYKGSVDAGIQIYRKYGIRGLYLGFNSTLLREVLAMAVYFTSYEYMMRLCSSDGESIGRTPIFISFLAGGISGSSSWLFTYPIDYAKTLVQSQNLERIQFRGALHCALCKYKEEGIRTFFKGLGVTMLRSFPVNGLGFFSFEYMMRLTGRRKE